MSPQSSENNVKSLTPRLKSAGTSSAYQGIDPPGSGGGGGGMDEVYKRLREVETAVTDIRERVSGIAASIPYLATKADVGAVENAIHRSHVSMIKWLVGIVLGAFALAGSIAGVIIRLLP